MLCKRPPLSLTLSLPPWPQRAWRGGLAPSKTWQGPRGQERPVLGGPPEAQVPLGAGTGDFLVHGMVGAVNLRMAAVSITLAAWGV